MAPGRLLHYPFHVKAAARPGSFDVKAAARPGTGSANAGANVQACRRLAPAL